MTFPSWEITPWGTNGAVRVFKHTSPCSREVWEFTYFDSYLNLVRYAIEQRLSTRHRKWVAHKLWTLHFDRSNTIEAEAVPELSDQVRQWMALTFVSRLSVRQRMGNNTSVGAKLHDRVWSLDALRPTSWGIEFVR